MERSSGKECGLEGRFPWKEVDVGHRRDKIIVHAINHLTMRLICA